MRYREDARLADGLEVRGRGLGESSGRLLQVGACPVFMSTPQYIPIPTQPRLQSHFDICNPIKKTQPEAEEAEEGDEDDDGYGRGMEAEEGDEDDEPTGPGAKRKRRERETDAQLQAAVESMVAKVRIF
jgi:hypothetical protein